MVWGKVFISIAFAAVSIFALGWMFRNLYIRSKREAVSFDPSKWFSQSLDVVLKPFLFFTVASLFLMGCMFVLLALGAI